MNYRGGGSGLQPRSFKFAATSRFHSVPKEIFYDDLSFIDER